MTSLGGELKLVLHSPWGMSNRVSLRLEPGRDPAPSRSERRSSIRIAAARLLAAQSVESSTGWQSQSPCIGGTVFFPDIRTPFCDTVFLALPSWVSDDGAGEAANMWPQTGKIQPSLRRFLATGARVPQMLDNCSATFGQDRLDRGGNFSGRVPSTCSVTSG